MGLSVERIEALRKTPIMSDGSDTGKITNFDIEFKGVDFSYNNVPVVKQLNLKIPSHKLTALVGPSGSGKTTLTRLIARFWDVDKGEIRLNGKISKIIRLITCCRAFPSCFRMCICLTILFTTILKSAMQMQLRNKYWRQPKKHR